MCLWGSHKGKRCATNIKMDIIVARGVLKYLQKRGMIPSEINEGMVQIFSKDSSSYATVKTWTVEFRWSRDRTEDDSRSGHSKTSTTEQIDVINPMILDERRLTL